MARKATPAKTPAAAAAAAVKAAKPVTSTPVRHTAIPKASPAAKPAITHEMIATRAFEISCGPTRGSEMDNWLRAERELGV
jgi:hypothetical protein